MITIIAIGKKHEGWVSDGIARYQKRLSPPWNIDWQLLPHSSLEGEQAKNEESSRLAARIDSASYVILLDETGKQFDSPTFAKLCDDKFAHGQSVTLIIGGAYGVSDDIKSKVDLVWSLSPLVLPHQLVRLVLVEQIYRAQEIQRGSRYHHI